MYDAFASYDMSTMFGARAWFPVTRGARLFFMRIMFDMAGGLTCHQRYVVYDSGQNPCLWCRCYIADKVGHVYFNFRVSILLAPLLL